MLVLWNVNFTVLAILYLNCTRIPSDSIVLFFIVLCLRRGVVFGLWSACASVGNILGACLASSVLQYGYEVGISF